MVSEVDIYFSDLDEVMQAKILNLFQIATPEEMNWDVIPIFALDKPFAKKYKNIVKLTPLT